MTSDLQRLGRRLVGRWTSEATHRALPDTILSGTGQFEWLDGQAFIVFRSHCDHPDIPDAISLIGDTDGLQMHYFDSRGVHRLFDVTVVDDGWAITMDRRATSRSFVPTDAPFSQRITYVFDSDDRKMTGKAQVSHDEVTWEDDLAITYDRADSR